jgi:hypothetical protein
VNQPAGTFRPLVQHARDGCCLIHLDTGIFPQWRRANGYNAANGEVWRHARSRHPGSTKVTRLALQKPASVAELLLTTEVVIAGAEG